MSFVFLIKCQREQYSLWIEQLKKTVVLKEVKPGKPSFSSKKHVLLYGSVWKWGKAKTSISRDPWVWSHLTLTIWPKIVTQHLIYSRAVNCEMSFWYLQFSHKTNNKFDFTTMVPQVELFSSVFWENWRHKKVISKLTDL